MISGKVYLWIRIIICCSFIGFCVENLWICARFGYMDNRNMHLPFLLGYGIAVFLIYMLIGEPQEEGDPIYFMQVFFMVSCGEVTMGLLVEKVCGFYYWDYSALPFHVTRYTSLFTSLGFTLMTMGFMRNVFPSLNAYFSSHATDLNGISCLLCMTAIIADHVASFVYMRNTASLQQIWRIYFRNDNHTEPKALLNEKG